MQFVSDGSPLTKSFSALGSGPSGEGPGAFPNPFSRLPCCQRAGRAGPRAGPESPGRHLLRGRALRPVTAQSKLFHRPGSQSLVYKTNKTNKRKP